MGGGKLLQKTNITSWGCSKLFLPALVIHMVACERSNISMNIGHQNN